MSEDRADAFLRMIQRSRRGRLKIYLGYAAGVGKTYQMLQEGLRLREQGIDVVSGLVETHGRADIARLAGGLELVPRRKQEYRGIVLEEMDIDAVLARRPQIVLIDELAHTNTPGSRNQKRYQDVQDILSQGIHVITTLNVQHLESLYDIVERASGVRVYERLPDSVLSDADQIVNVDVTTEDLNARLKEGRIYPRERVEAAMENFFRKSNLEQLRELTLRELASQIDLRSREDVGKDLAATPDQVMVCLSSRGPNSGKLLRYGSRLAGRLNRSWYAVYVQTPSEDALAIDAQTQRILSETLTLAKQLGAIVFTFKGEDVARTILQFAKEYRVGHIITGSPDKIPAWRRVLGRRNIVERLLDNANGVTIVTLDTRTPDQVPVPPLDTGIVEETDTGHLPAQRGSEPSRSQESGQMLLSRFLSREGIIVWERPVMKNDLLRDLILAAGRTGEINSRIDCLHAIHERENQGSTFYNEGVAFPHARIEGLKRSVVALGVTRGGVSDVTTTKPVECVFLILTPKEIPDEQVKILGLASRAARDRHLMEKIISESQSEEIFKDMSNWELTLDNRISQVTE